MSREKYAAIVDKLDGGIPRPRSVGFRDGGVVDSATAERSIPRPRSGRFRDRGAVDKIAVGRARASAASLRATRGTANHHAPTAERSHCITRGRQLGPCGFRSLAKRARPVARTLIEVYLHIVFSTKHRANIIHPEIEAEYRLRYTLSLGLKMRPLRGRCVTAGGSAGHARARCARPRATHGYFIDRSAVAEFTGPLPGA